jgi:hypothetical protein
MEFRHVDGRTHTVRARTGRDGSVMTRGEARAVAERELGVAKRPSADGRFAVTVVTPKGPPPVMGVVRTEGLFLTGAEVRAAVAAGSTVLCPVCDDTHRYCPDLKRAFAAETTAGHEGPTIVSEDEAPRDGVIFGG